MTHPLLELNFHYHCRNYLEENSLAVGEWNSMSMKVCELATNRRVKLHVNIMPITTHNVGNSFTKQWVRLWSLCVYGKYIQCTCT